LASVRFEGAERVPAGGGVLLAVNHTAYLDGPLVYGLLPRPAVFLVKAEAFRGPVGLVLRRTGQIPVRRGLAERAPLVAALGTLADGGVVGVFPEGTRGGGDVERVEHGIAYLALRSGCPVLPVACHGTAELRGRRAMRPRRPPVLVVVGDPIMLPAGRSVGRRTVAAAAERVRTALAAHVAATRPPRT
jgi:1-acyl-sn-glycerol-3-phosphate acyltransferase